MPQDMFTGWCDTGCGTITAHKNAKGVWECLACAAAQKVTYPVRMPAPCAFANCFDSAANGYHYCLYHQKEMTPKY